MARKPKLSVYERITEKQNEIKMVEENLRRLNEELQVLFSERDKIEMERLFSLMKSSGLTIDKAEELLQSNHNK